MTGKWGTGMRHEQERLGIDSIERAGEPRARRTHIRALLCATLALAAWAAAAAPAQAGVYDVVACDAAPGGAVSSLLLGVDDGRMISYQNCPTNGNPNQGIWQMAPRDAGTIGFLKGASAWFGAPAGSYVDHIRWSGNFSRRNCDWSVGMVSAHNPAVDGSNTWRGGLQAYANCDIYGQSWPVDIAIGIGARYFRIEARCGNWNGCHTTTWGGDRVAKIRTSRLIARVVDPYVPSVGPAGGCLNGTCGWIRGTHTINFGASDAAGIAHTNFRVGDAYINGGGWGCDYTRPIPCNNVGSHYSLNTSSLSDGCHTARISAADGAWNWSSYDRTFCVDNTAPARVKLALDERPEITSLKGWRRANQFEVRWQSPASSAPIVRAHYRLCRVDDPANCTAGSQSGNGIDRLSNFSLPARGAYTIRVWLEDAAGNVNADNPSDPIELRFDDVEPGRAAPTQINGWLNAREAAAYSQIVRMEPGAVIPISEIQGYSVTLDGSDPDCTIDVEGKVATYRINDLPEGHNTIKARAISNADVCSPEITQVSVPVDKTPPVLSVDNVPNPEQWHRVPISLRLRGADQEHLSGMKPAPAGAPVEDGAYLAYRVSDGPAQKVRGDTAGVDLTTDGRHVLVYHAVDFAGNPSEEKVAIVKIDRTPPEAAFEHIDPRDPQRIALATSDAASGVAAGAIEMRAATSTGAWTPLGTWRDGNRFLARFDDTQLEPGTYEFRALVRDVAGNERLSDRRADGGKLELRLPLRSSTRAEAGVDAGLRCAPQKKKKGSRKRKCVPATRSLERAAKVGHGKRASIVGHIGAGLGFPLAGTRLDVLSRPRAAGFDLRRIGAVTTDGQGFFQYTAPKGPSRLLRFSYPGSPVLRPTYAEVELRVPARSSLKASRKRVLNGGTVTFSGKLSGGHVPRGGRAVELQAYFRKRWRTFASPRTSSKGRWKHRYRFEATSGKVRYRFRVRIQREEAYPFELGHSRVANVVVRGR